MSKMSRDKGARFEREVANLFKIGGFPEAYRSAQYCGYTGHAADIEGVEGIHIECKHAEKMRLYDWMEQAIRDADAHGEGYPVVIHKQNYKDVLVTMRWNDWLDLFREWSNR